MNMAQKPARRHPIADIRIRVGLTQPEFAHVIGCSCITVQKIEQGHLRLSKRLALNVEKHFGVSVDYLLSKNQVRNKFPVEFKWFFGPERITPITIGWANGAIPEFY
jgi:DNA-binding XRE family transcriptional regulator